MGTFSVSTHVNASPERTFEVFSNIRNSAENVSGIERVEILDDSGEPVGVGTRFRETRILFKKEATEEMEITAWDPPRSYVVEAESCGTHYRSVISFEPNDDGSNTKVTMEFNAKALTFAGRMMSVFGFLFTGTMRKLMQRDLDDLRGVAERGAE